MSSALFAVSAGGKIEKRGESLFEDRTVTNNLLEMQNKYCLFTQNCIAQRATGKRSNTNFVVVQSMLPDYCNFWIVCCEAEHSNP